MAKSSRREKSSTQCATCDAVCCRLVVVLESQDEIPNHLTTRLAQGQRTMAHGEDGWCIAMDRTRMNCGIYENRPAVCQRFAMGGPYCRAIRAEYKK
jgi:uncharacterized protein